MLWWISSAVRQRCRVSKRISIQLPFRTQHLLLEALLESYPNEVITGFLVDAYVSCSGVIGNAYKAWSYPEHALLTSGEISEVVQYEHRWLIKTRENDCLVIVNFARGGRQSLLHLIDLFQTARLTHSDWCIH